MRWWCALVLLCAAVTSGVAPATALSASLRTRAYRNPYCELCTLVFHAMNLKGVDQPAAALCEYAPLNKQQECEVLAGTMRRNRDVQLLVQNGCIDKTRPLSFEEEAALASQPTADPRQRAGANCPGVVACNVLESHSGGPMCGARLRYWGDFLRQDSFERPVRPTPYDTFPETLEPPSGNPAPWLASTFGDANCMLCIDIMTALGREKESLAEQSCQYTPFSMKEQCERLVPVIRQNKDARKIVLEGCADMTSLLPMELGPGKCSGMVACNMMERHSGGPFCGQRLREWGDFVAGGESEDREYEAKVLGLGPLMQA